MNGVGGEPKTWGGRMGGRRSFNFFASPSILRFFGSDERSFFNLNARSFFFATERKTVWGKFDEKLASTIDI